MAQQKLYTEEQVKEMISMTDMIMYGNLIPNNDILASFTPIELPSDEEIREKSHNYFIRGQLGFEAPADTERAFLRGVLWMRDKILNK